MSTATSRRATLATLAGFIAVPALPAVAAAANPDAAIFAMAPRLDDLLRAATRAEDACRTAGELVAEMTGPVPQKPRDAHFFPRLADYQAVVRRYEDDVRHRAERIAQVEAATGFADLEAAFAAADKRLFTAIGELAEMRATTLEGLILKARYVDHALENDLCESIAADLIAMGGEA